MISLLTRSSLSGKSTAAGHARPPPATQNMQPECGYSAAFNAMGLLGCVVQFAY
jgi:hypothetical protein